MSDEIMDAYKEALLAKKEIGPIQLGIREMESRVDYALALFRARRDVFKSYIGLFEFVEDCLDIIDIRLNHHGRLSLKTAMRIADRLDERELMPSMYENITDRHAVFMAIEQVLERWKQPTDMELEENCRRRH